MNKIVYVIAAILIAAGLGFGYGRYSTPTKVEIQEKQVITKQTEVVYREVKQPDGTTIKETITKDTSTNEKDKSNKTTYEKPKSKVSLTVKYNFDQKQETYGILYQRRIGDSPLFGAVGITTDKEVSAGIGMEF